MVDVKQIVERLIEAVPPPRTAPPRPQGSWASLKLRDVLVAPGFDPGESGNRELWEVVAVTSAGVTIDSLNNSKLLDNRNWKEAGWRKLAKRELKKLGESDEN